MNESSQPGPSIQEVIRAKRSEFELGVDDLAELTGIEKSRLQMLEGGLDEEPTFAELRQLSRFLGIDLETYDPEEVSEPESLPEVVTLLKSNENYLPNEEWATVIDAAESARELVRIERWLGLPQRFRELRERFQPRSLSNKLPWKQGQLLSLKVRRELDLGDRPVDSMHQLCRDLGVVIIETFLPVSVSALCLADKHHGPTIILNVQGTNDSLLPRRFAIAHELCHILFDEYEMERLQRFDDAPGFFEAKNKPDVEKRADAFAIHLLCPESAVRKEWLHAGEDDSSVEDRVRRLMEVFGVSFTAIKGHLQSLDLISRREADSLSMVNTDTPQKFLDAERHANPTAYDDAFKSLERLRRGEFLERVLQAHRRGDVTRSAALELLDLDGTTFDENVDRWRQFLLDGDQPHQRRRPTTPPGLLA